MSIITSRANIQVKHVKKLIKNSAYRYSCREFVAEGAKMLSEALAAGAAISRVFLTEEKYHQSSDLIKTLPVTVCSPEVMEGLSDVQTPQELTFCCKFPDKKMPDETKGRILILDSLRDPGNMGTILRSADAFSIDAVFLCGDCVDCYNPKVIRSTMGAIFRVPFYAFSYQALIDYLKNANITLYAAVLSKHAEDARVIDWENAAVAIGNEAAGVSRPLMEAADRFVTLPMDGQAESLNAAVAASILMWEMMRSH